MEIIFYPDYVITLDSIESGNVPSSRGPVDGLYDKARPLLKNKSFWKLLCRSKKPAGGVFFEIIIDSTTGIILNVTQ